MSREIIPGLNYFNEKGKTRKVLAVVDVYRGTWVYYLDSSRTRREGVAQIIDIINRRRGVEADHLPESWGLETPEDHHHIFSCSGRAFLKWLGSGTVEEVEAPVEISIESSTPEDPVMLERERCLQLVEYRCRRLLKVIKNYPPGHTTHSRISASIENLRVVSKWISSGKAPKETAELNPGGST